jgi:hypothetical protein
MNLTCLSFFLSFSQTLSLGMAQDKGFDISPRIPLRASFIFSVHFFLICKNHECGPDWLQSGSGSSILPQSGSGSTCGSGSTIERLKTIFFKTLKIKSTVKAKYTVLVILLRDIQLTHVQRSEVQLLKRCFLTKIFILNEANTLVALPNAWRRSVRALS